MQELILQISNTILCLFLQWSVCIIEENYISYKNNVLFYSFADQKFEIKLTGLK